MERLSKSVKACRNAVYELILKSEVERIRI